MILSKFFSFFGFKKQQKKSKEEIEMRKMFNEWKTRKKYKVLTTEIIDLIPDSELEQAIFDNIYEHIKNDFENELYRIKKLSKGQQAFWSTWILEGEVNNGGYNQFYFNSSGQFGEMAEAGFLRIGAKKFSELTKEANRIYLENKERLEDYNDGTIKSFKKSYKGNPLNDLDDKFYEFYKFEDIGSLRIKYIRENKNEFTVLPN